jgi:adenosylcobinamide-GDP ribazoletransferase
MNYLKGIHELKSLFIALQFLTIIPLRPSARIEERDIAHSMSFFPLVGMMIGGFLIIINLITSGHLSPFIASALLLIGWVGITGAFHLDGFADTVDGLCGGKNKEQVLRIMKDSFIGAKGAIALILLLLLKFTLLVGLTNDYKNYALLFAPIAGRWSMVAGIYLSSYARKEGLAKAFFSHKTRREIFWASLITFCLGLILFRIEFFYIIGIALAINLLLIIYFKKRIGGLTGDNLGALNEIIEVITLFSLYCLKIA